MIKLIKTKQKRLRVNLLVYELGNTLFSAKLF